MPTTLPARGVRVGGVTIAPGVARAVSIPLSPRPRREADGADAARALPAWVAVGAKAGPRVTVVAAARGTEIAATAAARALAHALDPTTMAGSVVVVPVLGPGGRFARRRRPGAGWIFPGDAGGAAHARDAVTVFSELVVGAGALVVLGAPRGGRRATLTITGDLEDPRVKRLAAESGALVARPCAARRTAVRSRERRASRASSRSSSRPPTHPSTRRERPAPSRSASGPSSRRWA